MIWKRNEVLPYTSCSELDVSDSEEVAHEENSFVIALGPGRMFEKMKNVMNGIEHLVS